MRWVMCSRRCFWRGFRRYALWQLAGFGFAGFRVCWICERCGIVWLLLRSSATLWQKPTNACSDRPHCGRSQQTRLHRSQIQQTPASVCSDRPHCGRSQQTPPHRSRFRQPSSSQPAAPCDKRSSSLLWLWNGVPCNRRLFCARFLYTVLRKQRRANCK